MEEIICFLESLSSIIVFIYLLDQATKMFMARIREGHSFGIAMQAYFSHIKHRCSAALTKLVNGGSSNNHYYIIHYYNEVCLAAMQLIMFSSLNEFAIFLNENRDADCNKEVILICSSLVNLGSWSFLKSTSSEPDFQWYKTKRRILKEFIWKRCMESPSIITDEILYLMGCAKLIGSDSLERKIRRHVNSTLRIGFTEAQSQTMQYFIAWKDENFCNFRREDLFCHPSVYIQGGDPQDESYRLSTFINFPRTTVNPHDLAAAGFYYTGYRDRIKCFCCGLYTEGWAFDDNIHPKRWHRPYCEMVKRTGCRNAATSSREGTSRQATVNPSFSSNTNLHSQNIKFSAIHSHVHEQLVRSLDLWKESDRLRTFNVTRAEKFKVPPADLARSGFFYLGNIDRVQCFSCGGVLRGWETGHNVEAEHTRHFPCCRIVTRREYRNIPISNADVAMPSNNSSSERRNSNERDLRSAFPCRYPLSPLMRSMEARLATFDYHWPFSHFRTTPESFAEAGFFFLGERDTLRCWYCDGGLENLEPDDDPWREHAKWFPNKSPDFVRQVVSEYPNLRQPILPDLRPQPSTFGSASRYEPRASTPPLIVPQEGRDRAEEIFQTAMNSDIVQDALGLGFEPLVVECVVRRRLMDIGIMYPSLRSLVDALHDAEEESRRSEESEDEGIGDGSDDSETDIASDDNEDSVESSQENSSLAVEKRIEAYKRGKCIKCNNREVDIQFEPCGHNCCCLDCVRLLTKCPFCGSNVEGLVFNV